MTGKPCCAVIPCVVWFESFGIYLKYQKPVALRYWYGA